MTSGEPILRAVQRAFDEDQQGAEAHAPQREPATASPVRSARIDPLFSPVPEVRRRALAMVSRSRIGPDEVRDTPPAGRREHRDRVGGTVGPGHESLPDKRPHDRPGRRGHLVEEEVDDRAEPLG